MNETEKNEVGNKKKTKNNMEDDVEIYRYIGETSRSTNERGSEHKKDLEAKITPSKTLRWNPWEWRPRQDRVWYENDIKPQKCPWI